MFSHSECACVAAGAVALGAIVLSNHRHVFAPPATQCSARHGAVSARAAKAAADETKEDEAVLASDDLFPQVGEDFDKQMRQVRMGGAKEAQKATAAMKREQFQNYTEPTFSKQLGSTPLIAGRCPDKNALGSVAGPKVTGGCLFYQSEGYAEAFRQQEMD